VEPYVISGAHRAAMSEIVSAIKMPFEHKFDSFNFYRAKNSCCSYRKSVRKERFCWNIWKFSYRSENNFIEPSK